MADTIRDILREALPLLLLMAVVEVVAGSFLGHMETSLEQLPGLLALVPAVLAMRGNIYASMASRLGTAMRFGSIPRDRWVSPVVRENITASMVLSILMASVAAVLAHVTTRLTGAPSAGIPTLAAIALVASVLSGVVMTGVALLVMRVSFQRGVDMDNIAGPVIMTTGDLFTLLALLAAVHIPGVVA